MKTSGTYPRVSLAFARKIDTDLIAFTRNVITLMTGNPQYPTPSPALTVVTTAVNALETAVHDALDGGKIAIATRNAARAEMLSLLRQLLLRDWELQRRPGVAAQLRIRACEGAVSGGCVTRAGKSPP